VQGVLQWGLTVTRPIHEHARMSTAAKRSHAIQHPPVNAMHAKHVRMLTVCLAVSVALSAWGAHFPHDWLLENALIVAALPILWTIYRKLPFSRLSWTLVFVFLYLHEVGAHYTYSKVPYDEYSRAWFGFSINEALGWQRNNFDRVVHFFYGLLLAYPIREIFLSLANARGFWSYFLPLDVTLSSSALYELIEWAAAEVFGGDVGQAYLGTQGDVWDAHKDMVLATVGALLALVVTLIVNRHYQRDFAREWATSLRVRRRR
jgi:putative membrane protein